MTEEGNKLRNQPSFGMNQFLKSTGLIRPTILTSEILGSKVNHFCSCSSSLQPITEDSLHQPLNPFHNMLPNIENPSQLVNLISSTLLNPDNINFDKIILLQEHKQNHSQLFAHLGLKEISRILLRCQSNSSAALSFFNWVKSYSGITPNDQNYCLLVHILVWHKNFKEAMQLLSELILSNQDRSFNVFKALLMSTDKGDCNWDPVVFDMLIKAYLKRGKVKEGFRAFRKMVLLGLVPSIIAVNFLLNGLSKLNYGDKCWEVYEVMGRAGLHPNTCTFNILTHVLCKEGNVDKVNEFLQKMEEEGFEPDIVTYNMLVDSYCKRGRLKDGIHLYEIMYIRGVIPDLVTHTSLINSLCKGGNMKEAHKLFHGMVARGIKPDNVLYNTLICGYCKEGLMREARLLLHDMIGNEISPDNFTCLKLVEGYMRHQKMGSAVNLIVELQRFKICVPHEIYDHLITALCKENKPFAAKSLLDWIPQGRYQLSGELNEKMIYSLCECNDADQALHLKTEMLAKNEKSSLAIYRVIISCLCRLRRLSEAESLMNEMIRYGLLPNSEICRSLVTAHCKERDFDKAKALVRLFASEFKIFDSTSYNSLTEILSEDGDMSKLVELFEEMMKVGYTPTRLTWKHMFNGFSRATEVQPNNAMVR